MQVCVRLPLNTASAPWQLKLQQPPPPWSSHDCPPSTPTPAEPQWDTHTPQTETNHQLPYSSESDYHWFTASAPGQLKLQLPPTVVFPQLPTKYANAGRASAGHPHAVNGYQIPATVQLQVTLTLFRWPKVVDNQVSVRNIYLKRQGNIQPCTMITVGTLLDKFEDLSNE